MNRNYGWIPRERIENIKNKHIQTIHNCYGIYGPDLRNLSNTLLRKVIEELDKSEQLNQKNKEVFDGGLK